MAYKTKTGIILRNPAEKAKRYARQMKSGCVKETGEPLTKEDMAYRAGYLDARNDSAKAFNHNMGIKKVKKKSQKIINEKDYDYVIAKRYAEHMGVKYGLSNKEIESNIIAHYHSMKKDSEFKKSLYEDYAFELHRKK